MAKQFIDADVYNTRVLTSQQSGIYTQRKRFSALTNVQTNMYICAQWVCLCVYVKVFFSLVCCYIIIRTIMIFTSKASPFVNM